MQILIVDDHLLFRKALIKLIDSFKMGISFKEAASSAEALEHILQFEFHLIILDIQLAEGSGLDFLKQLRAKGYTTKVVILTQFDSQSLIVYALQLGANGFLLKSVTPEELKISIQSVMTDGHYYNQLVQKAIEVNLSGENKLSNLDISPREFQVLVLLKDGKSNKEVANDLGLTPRTIESYRKALIKKIKCKNSVELVSLAYKTGIMPQ